MGRRAAEFRRPIRRKLSYGICFLLGAFSVVGLVMVFVQHNYHQDRVQHTLMERNTKDEHFPKDRLNFTEEILSATSFSRQLTEEMVLAKAYVVIAKEHNNLHLAWELSSKIRSCQLLLSKAAMTGMPVNKEEAEPIIRSLSTLIFKAQDIHYDIATTIVTMKSQIQALEERAIAATVQSNVFAQISAEALPKSLHCLHVKLTSDWLKKPSLQKLSDETRNSLRLTDQHLYHFCIFSDNVLATSVVVNSTVLNAEFPIKLVFHIVTDGVNYGTMQAWFLSNDFKGATIEIQNVEEFHWLNESYSPIVKQLLDSESRAFYFGAYPDVNAEPKLRNSKFLLLLNHLRFYIPEIYPQLEKIVFLDDDVVVQKDLTPLFSLELHGNVIGAVETCLEAFHRYYKYFNFSNSIISSKFDPQACAWSLGMNVFDLIQWKKANVTAIYHYWQEKNADGSLWKLGTLPPALLSFYGLAEPLDRRWHVLGLGHDLNIDNRLIESAAVIHFNGNMKPWLRLSISRYRPLWHKYINQSHPYFQICAIG
ncbi:putative polygalacturonate 4-alpha-galacturonosyltransferase [Medicago truncatula]|uniref:Hexosyltransferase n=1 Tax=Medicago truncatula TaxID=3880 RepID=A0A396J7Q2_MEDTR|nr:hexosyltransferase GAUT11 [Medicago truncatula]RHN74249.1 putative polygalacturonate 4-alpha-galacturonosyltransferase [Medicago truncatula]